MSTKTNDPKQTAPETAPAAEDVKADTAAKTEEAEEAPVKKAEKKVVVFNDMDKHMAELILHKKLRQLDEKLAAKGVTDSVSTVEKINISQNFLNFFFLQAGNAYIPAQHFAPCLYIHSMFHQDNFQAGFYPPAL